MSQVLSETAESRPLMLNDGGDLTWQEMRSPGGGPLSCASNKCCERGDSGKQRSWVITPAAWQGRAYRRRSFNLAL